MQLKREITNLGLLFTSISCMIGSGWLFGPIIAAKIAGPAAILSWPIGGFMILILALTFAELSTAFPLAGGLARYTQFSHGSFMSFILSWMAWLSCISVAPTEVQAILQYSSKFFPNHPLTFLSDQTTILTGSGLIIAFVLLLLMSCINLLSIHAITSSNALFSFWKLSVPTIVIIAIFIQHHDFSNLTSTPGGFAPHGFKGVFEALPAAVVFSFLGFREATTLAGETKDPKVAIPLAVIGSVLICTLLYSLIQLVFIIAIPKSMLTHGWHFSINMQNGPFAELANILGLFWIGSLIYADAIISPLGTGFIYTATTARINYAMSQNGYIPSCFTRLNINGVPAVAILFNCFVGMALFFPFPEWKALVQFQSMSILLAYSAGPICLLSFRKQFPHVARPFTLPFPKIFASLSFCTCNLLIYWSGWETVSRLMIGIILGLLFLFLSRQKSIANNNLEQTLNLKNSLWLSPYLLGLSFISYFGQFGHGKNMLPLGMDFVLILIFSIIILALALHQRIDDQAAQQSLLADPSEKNWKNIEI
jgi:amino acid transporter